jgi:hypothetical protein
MCIKNILKTSITQQKDQQLIQCDKELKRSIIEEDTQIDNKT